MFAGSIEDRTLIRERYGAYSDAVFQQDAEAWLANFSDAAVWEIFGKKIQGQSAMGWAMEKPGKDGFLFRNRFHCRTRQQCHRPLILSGNPLA